MADIATVGSLSSHGGTITTGSSSFSCEGKPVARVGDTHVCPEHGTNTIVSSPISDFTNEGEEVATVGAVTGCGAVITTGQSIWNAS